MDAYFDPIAVLVGIPSKIYSHMYTQGICPKILTAAMFVKSWFQETRNRVLQKV